MAKPKKSDPWTDLVATVYDRLGILPGDVKDLARLFATSPELYLALDESPDPDNYEDDGRRLLEAYREWFDGQRRNALNTADGFDPDSKAKRR